MRYRNISMSASEERLETLIRRRLEKDADREAIDSQIWDLFGEDWCVMFTDLSGFSRGVAQFGIIHFLQTIYEANRILGPVIEEYGGILLKVEGDSYLVIFRKPERALDCSVRMNQILDDYNKKMPEEERILLCVGLGFGRVLRIGDADVFGAEVNAASKLGEDMAKSAEILVTDNFRSGVILSRGEKYVSNWTKLDEAPSGATAAWKVSY